MKKSEKYIPPQIWVWDKENGGKFANINRPISGSTHIKDYVTIAGKSDIGPHIEIGQEAVIAARSCVLKSLPGKEIYAGNPARTLKEKQKRDAVSTRVSIIEKKLRKNASKTTNN